MQPKIFNFNLSYSQARFQKILNQTYLLLKKKLFPLTLNLNFLKLLNIMFDLDTFNKENFIFLKNKIMN